MEGVGEGSSGRCCPNAEDPSKMHSRDATYRIQEGRRDGVSERSKYSKGKAGERHNSSLKTSDRGGVREDENEWGGVVIKCFGGRC